MEEQRNKFRTKYKVGIRAQYWDDNRFIYYIMVGVIQRAPKTPKTQSIYLVFLFRLQKNALITAPDYNKTQPNLDIWTQQDICAKLASWVQMVSLITSLVSSTLSTT